jgi:hypothetical protein
MNSPIERPAGLPPTNCLHRLTLAWTVYVIDPMSSFDGGSLERLSVRFASLNLEPSACTARVTTAPTPSLVTEAMPRAANADAASTQLVAAG